MLHDRSLWFVDLINFLVANGLLKNLSKPQIDKFKSKAKCYMWDDPYLRKFCSDQVVRRCVHDAKFNSILSFCHSFACGGHFRPKRMAGKVLDYGFY